jgi:nitroreductase
MLLPVANGAATGVPYVGFAEDARAALQTWNAEGTVIDLISPMATVIAPTDAIVLDEFITSRRSVRDFDETRQVDPAIVVEAVRLASHTPSVCNRQAARVHEYRGHENAARILAHQNGNAGFRDQVQNVLVVTVERGLFAGASERNQRWIDGGLFAMTLVWALHGLGVSSCMLNWSMTNDRSDALRAAAGIPSSEDVICMIAIGYPPDGGVRVARSPRRPVEQILTMH